MVRFALHMNCSRSSITSLRRHSRSYLNRCRRHREAECTAGKHIMEMAAIHYWFENTLEDMAQVEGVQCQPVHTSFDNSSHSPGTPKRDHILDVRDRSSLPDQERSHRYIDMATVKAKASVLDQSHIHRR